MDREKLIRILEAKKKNVNTRLIKGSRYLLDDFAKFCKFEKEIEIQQSYLNYE